MMCLRAKSCDTDSMYREVMGFRNPIRKQKALRNIEDDFMDSVRI